MSKISIEVGHGGSDSGALTTDKKVFEKDINLVVALELKRQLERHGQTVLISRTTDVNDTIENFYPKVQAFKPDVGISVHTNAFNGTAKGFEVFKNTNSFKTKSELLCYAIETEVKALGQTSRGIKDGGFIMNNLPCPTAYCELGFMDNPNDYAQFNTIEEQKKFGIAYAKGVLKYLGVAWKNETSTTTSSNNNKNTTTTNPGTVYRVIAGSYSVKENAETHCNELKKKGIECFIAAYKL